MGHKNKIKTPVEFKPVSYSLLATQYWYYKWIDINYYILIILNIQQSEKNHPSLWQ
jgi:hypothetical protein